MSASQNATVPPSFLPKPSADLTSTVLSLADVSLDPEYLPFTGSPRSRDATCDATSQRVMSDDEPPKRVREVIEIEDSPPRAKAKSGAVLAVPKPAVPAVPQLAVPKLAMLAAPGPAAPKPPAPQPAVPFKAPPHIPGMLPHQMKYVYVEKASLLDAANTGDFATFIEELSPHWETLTFLQSQIADNANGAAHLGLPDF